MKRILQKKKLLLWGGLILSTCGIVIFGYFSSKTFKTDLPETRAKEFSQTTFTYPEKKIQEKDLEKSTLPSQSSEENLSLPKGRDGSFLSSFSYTSEVIKADFPFNAIGPVWGAKLPKGTNLLLAIKISDGKSWSGWQKIDIDDDLTDLNKLAKEEKGEEIFGGLYPTGEGKSFQYRVTLKTKNGKRSPSLEKIKFVYLDSNKGPNLQKEEREFFGKTEAAISSPRIISRAGWGANPKYMTWPPEYSPVKKFILHHTTGPQPSDPPAFMRAIYYYHAVTRGWGDIGYNFVLDQYGNIYEGRAGGDNVVGAHAYHYNYGSSGIAAMGTYSTTYLNSAQLSGLASIIGYKGATYNVNPTGRSYLYDKYLYNVAGHRDVNQTACPGDAFYSQLGKIRNSALYKYYLYSQPLALTSYSIGQKVISGQENVAQASLKNIKNEPITLSSLGVAVRYGAEVENFDPQTNITFQAGETKTFTFKKTFNSLGTYKTWVYYYYNNFGYKISSDKYFSVLPITSALKLTGTSFAPQNPAVGEQVTATFSLKNETNSDITLDSTGAAVRYYTPYKIYKHNFPSDLKTVIPAGSSKSFSQNRSFVYVGSHRFWVYFYYRGAGYKISQDYWSSLLPITSKLKVSSFSLSPQFPLVGEKVTATFTLKNEMISPITLDSTGVAVRFGFVVCNFSPNTSLTIEANSSQIISQETTFSNLGAYKSWVYFYYNTVGYIPQGTVSEISTSKPFTVYQTKADPKLTSFTLPAVALTQDEVEASFSVKNLGDQPIVFESIGIAVRYENISNIRNFTPFTNITLAGYQEKTFTFRKTFQETGDYFAWAYYYSGGKGYIINPTSSNIETKKSFTAYSISDVLTSNSFSISPLKSGVSGEITTQFSLKNSFSSSITLDSTGVAVRYQDQNYNFSPSQNVTILPNSSQGFTFKKTFSQIGTYKSWPYFYYKNQGFRLPQTIYFEVISNPKTVRITGNGDFEVRKGGLLLDTLKEGEIGYTYYLSGWHYVTTPRFFGRTAYPVRFIPKGSTIMEVLSYSDPNWNNTLNYNKFRSIIEVRYSTTSSKLWVINELPLELYLRGVAESGNNNSLEYLKTMATAERSYALAHILAGGKHRGEPFHLKNSRKGNGVDQTYVGYNFEILTPNITAAAKATIGQVVTYSGNVVVTPYSSGTDGKRTRSWSEVWNGSVTWCVSVPDPYGYISGWNTLSGNHMVGLSAQGARGYAEKEGRNYLWILKHYYTGIAISSFDTSRNIRVAIYGISL